MRHIGAMMPQARECLQPVEAGGGEFCRDLAENGGLGPACGGSPARRGFPCVEASGEARACCDLGRGAELGTRVLKHLMAFWGPW